MKTISKTDWRYKLISVVFATKGGWMPFNTCQFHFYTIMAILFWVPVMLPEFIAAYVLSDYEDFKHLVKGTTHDVYKNVLKWSLVKLHTFVLFILFAISFILTFALTFAFSEIIPVLPIDKGALLNCKYFMLMLPVYCTIIKLILLGYKQLQFLCKPITYEGPEEEEPFDKETEN